jgi:hypothetical protein
MLRVLSFDVSSKNVRKMIMPLNGKERTMRCPPYTVFVVLFAAVLLYAQDLPLVKADQAATLAFAQKAAVQALNFRQGDAASLTQSRRDFTGDGWKDFMKHMEGWLDEKGAPTFTSSFVPSRDAVVVGQENGIVHLRIPGALKQTQNKSSTTYRAAIDVYAGGNPAKIQRLEQMTCAGASTACQ